MYTALWIQGFAPRHRQVIGHFRLPLVPAMSVLDKFDLRRMRLLSVVLLTIFIVGLIIVGYFCPDKVCALHSGPPTPPYVPKVDAYGKGTSDPYSFSESDLFKRYNFDIEGDHDVLVFLHMQKTGGTTFGKHLVRNIALKHPCECQKGKKRCDCLNGLGHYWLFSRYSTGWSCGLHADWTELKSCVSEALDKKEDFKRNRRYGYDYSK